VTHATTADSRGPSPIAFWQRLLGRGYRASGGYHGEPPWSEDLLDHLASYLADNGHDLKKLLEPHPDLTGLPSQPAVFAKEPAGGEYIFRGPELRRLSAEQFVDAVWMLRDRAGQSGRSGSAAGVRRVGAGRTDLRPRFPGPADALMRSLGRPNREQV